MGRRKRQFDLILKNLFTNSSNAILNIVGIRPSGKLKFLPTEFRIFKKLKPDLLFEFDDCIVHFEIQIGIFHHGKYRLTKTHLYPKGCLGITF